MTEFWLHLHFGRYTVATKHQANRAGAAESSQRPQDEQRAEVELGNHQSVDKAEQTDQRRQHAGRGSLDHVEFEIRSPLK